MRDPAFAGRLYLLGDVNQMAVVGAVRLMYGSALVRGSELLALRTLRSWGYAGFAAAAECFFSALLQSSFELLPFALLCAACRFCPGNAQLVDELAVCVDPRTVTAPAPGTAAEGPEEEAAFQRALEAAYFVLRASWLSQTRQMLAMPAAAAPSLPDLSAAEKEGGAELDRVLQHSGLGLYIAVMQKCQASAECRVILSQMLTGSFDQVRSLLRARQLDDATLARMNVRPQDRSRLRRACGEDAGAPRLGALADMGPAENQ